MGLGGIGAPSQHPGDLGDTLLLVKGMRKGCLSPAGLHGLGDHELRRCCGRDLRKVGDAEDLMTCAELLHLSGDLGRDLTSDIRIDFIKDKKGDPVLIRQRRL